MWGTIQPGAESSGDPWTPHLLLCCGEPLFCRVKGPTPCLEDITHHPQPSCDTAGTPVHIQGFCVCAVMRTCLCLANCEVFLGGLILRPSPEALRLSCATAANAH